MVDLTEHARSTIFIFNPRYAGGNKLVKYIETLVLIHAKQ